MIINVKVDYGAVGNNSTDDTTAIQNALNAAAGSGGVVYLPAGTYKISTTLNVPTRVTFLGEGAYASVLSWTTGSPDGTTACVNLTGDYAKIDSIGVSMTGGAYYRGIGYRANYCVVEDCRVYFNSASATGATGYGIWGPYSTSLTNCVCVRNEVSCGNAHGNKFMGIIFDSHLNLVVKDNHIHDILATTNTKQEWAIYIDDDCAGCLVEGNRCIDNKASGIHLNNSAPTFTDYGRRVVNNQIKNCEFNGIGVDYCKGALIQGNSISECDLLFYHDSNATGTIIDGNMFEYTVDGTGGPISANRGMVNLGGAYGVCSNNHFSNRGAATRGIDGADSSYWTVTGNTFGATRPAVAIHFSGTAQYNVVVGNNVADSDVTGANSAIELYGNHNTAANNVVSIGSAAYGMRVAGSACVAYDNVLFSKSNNASRGIWINGAYNVVRGNKLIGTFTGSKIHESSNTFTRIHDNYDDTGNAVGGATLGGGWIEFKEMTSDPGTPSADNARLFIRDNGGAKSQICVRWPSGNITVLGTEP